MAVLLHDAICSCAGAKMASVNCNRHALVLHCRFKHPRPGRFLLFIVWHVKVTIYHVPLACSLSFMDLHFGDEESALSLGCPAYILQGNEHLEMRGLFWTTLILFLDEMGISSITSATGVQSLRSQWIPGLPSTRTARIQAYPRLRKRVSARRYTGDEWSCGDQNVEATVPGRAECQEENLRSPGRPKPLLGHTCHGAVRKFVDETRRACESQPNLFRTSDLALCRRRSWRKSFGSRFVQDRPLREIPIRGPA